MVSLRPRRSSSSQSGTMQSDPPNNQEVTAGDPAHHRLLEAIRDSFWTGQTVPLHRALRRMRPRRSDVLSLLLVPVVVNWLMYYFRVDLSLFSMGMMFFFLDPLISDLRFAAFNIPAFDVSIYVPMIKSESPDSRDWWMGFALAAFLLICAAIPSRRLVALRYLCGFFGLVQLAAQLYVTLDSTTPPLHPQDYLVDAMTQTVFWIACVPWLFCLTFNLFPFSTVHKLRIIALTVCYQLMFFPVQYAWQAWVLHTGSSIWTALLYFSGAMPFNVLVSICFYGIGLAWPDAERPEH